MPSTAVEGGGFVFSDESHLPPELFSIQGNQQFNLSSVHLFEYPWFEYLGLTIRIAEPFRSHLERELALKAFTSSP